MPLSHAAFEDDGLADLPEPRPVHYAEQALLGALLLDPHRLDEIGLLAPGHFKNPVHSAVFAAMGALPAPDPDRHRTDVAWLGEVLTRARPQAPGLSASYLHALIAACPSSKHVVTYARMVRADHARRSLRTRAEQLAQTAGNATLPHRVAATVAQADSFGQFLDTLTGQFRPHPGSLPRTPPPPVPDRDTGEGALDEERSLLGAAAAYPDRAREMRWLVPDDFALPLHGALWQCMNALTHRGDPVDPITLLWEAQHRDLTRSVSARELMALVSAPVGSPEHWGEKVVQRALLHRTHTVAARIRAYTDDPSNTTHQLITGSRRALADLTTLRTRWQHTTAHPQPPRAPTRPRAGPPALTTSPLGTRVSR
ncbi:DnaB-like helicase N-terminal domain-containing protein [Streptomyces sp. NPDC093589]|uniref:DnaB-like helicase N-terminal domain-containing protein n=1 Tax=Streptomyces sp. NPDC093589 TaxID=3366043 RepID=UPI0037F17973